jgi:hypothetical protein
MQGDRLRWILVCVSLRVSFFRPLLGAVDAFVFLAGKLKNA